MLFKLKLKNSDAAAIIDSEVYEHIEQNEYFQKIDFLGNLRLHSAGYAVFQKSWRTADKSYKVETIYLHKYIAAKFLPKPTGRENDKMSVRLKNDNNHHHNNNNKQTHTHTHSHPLGSLWAKSEQ